MKADVIIVAGGNGIRAGKDKLLLPIGDDIILSRTVSVFWDNPNIAKIILVIRKDIFDVGVSIAKNFGNDTKKIVLVEGGNSRTESVENGLKEVTSPHVLIHDGARPFVTSILIDNIISALQKHSSAIPALHVADTVKIVKDNVVSATPNRNNFVTVQTPQGFESAKIKYAYQKRGNLIFSDDSTIFDKYCEPSYIIEGDAKNTKVTTPADFYGLNSKIGIGYDLHKLAPFRKLMLGGIEICSDFGEVAHSDGDVVIHALIDAMLSAIGERDIGTRFPDSDPKYRDIDSSIMLSEVYEQFKRENYKVSNISITIVLDKPKLCDYIPIMKIKLSNLVGTSAENIAISAKTTENTSPNTVEAYVAIIVT